VAIPAASPGVSTTSFPARVRHVVGRLSWGVADQALSSLTTFGIGICVVRLLGTRRCRCQGMDQGLGVLSK
jgi:hypothetical protein